MPDVLEKISTLAIQRRQLNRQRIDELLLLAEYLPDADRMLIEQVLLNGQPIAKIARMSRRPARCLQRRAGAILKRLSQQLFKFVAVRADALPSDVRLTARLVVLHGLSLRDTAEISGQSLHRTRQHMNTVHVTARLFS